MAQTGDVKFGNILTGYSSGMVGRGGSDFDNIKAEFSNIPFDRGTVGMASGSRPRFRQSIFYYVSRWTLFKWKLYGFWKSSFRYGYS